MRLPDLDRRTIAQADNVSSPLVRLVGTRSRKDQSCGGGLGPGGFGRSGEAIVVGDEAGQLAAHEAPFLNPQGVVQGGFSQRCSTTRRTRPRGDGHGDGADPPRATGHRSADAAVTLPGLRGQDGTSPSRSSRTGDRWREVHLTAARRVSALPMRWQQTSWSRCSGPAPRSSPPRRTTGLPQDRCRRRGASVRPGGSDLLTLRARCGRESGRAPGPGTARISAAAGA